MNTKKIVINNYLWCALLNTFLFLFTGAWKTLVRMKKSENDENPDEWWILLNSFNSEEDEKNFAIDDDCLNS